MRTEFRTDRVFADLAAAQAELDEWVSDYNTRPAAPGDGHGHPCPTVGEILFGDKFNLGSRDLTLLFLGSAAFILALTLAQALIALLGHGRALIAWTVGLVLCVGVMALGSSATIDDLFLRVELGYLAGCLGAAVMMTVFLLAAPAFAGRRPQRAHRGHRARAARDLIPGPVDDAPGARRHPAPRAPLRRRRGRGRDRPRAGPTSRGRGGGLRAHAARAQRPRRGGAAGRARGHALRTPHASCARRGCASEYPR